MVGFGEVLAFDPDQVQQIFALCSRHQQYCSRLGDGVKNLSDLHTWSGDAAEAAKNAAGKTRVDLDAHSREAAKVAAAARDCYDVGVALRLAAQRCQAEADALGLDIDPVSGTVTDPRPPVVASLSEVDRFVYHARMLALQNRVNNVIAAAERFDDDLAAAINAADGSISADSPLLGRESRQVAAFRALYHRDPYTRNEWRTAKFLDARTTEPLYGGMKANVVATKIRPVPGQGQVRGSLFITGKRVADPFGPPDEMLHSLGRAMIKDSYQDYGNNRGFDPEFDPQNAKGSFIIDYENGYVMYRQNPSVDTQNRRAIGTPKVNVSQASDGTVRLDYDSPNPLSNVGPVNVSELLEKKVTGSILASPSSTGPSVSGTIGDYPTAEVYNDRPDGSTVPLLQDPQDNHSSSGPILKLGSYHIVGELPSSEIMKELGYSPYKYSIAGAVPGLEDVPNLHRLLDHLPVPHNDDLKIVNLPEAAPGSKQLAPLGQ